MIEKEENKQLKKYKKIWNNLNKICSKCNKPYFEHVGTGIEWICPEKKEKEKSIPSTSKSMDSSNLWYKMDIGKLVMENVFGLKEKESEEKND